MTLKNLRPYFLPVITLITDLSKLGRRVIRQLILPTLARKGNLLSSLFVLFTGLVERVISFAETVARVPRSFELPETFRKAWAFSHKYLRQGMLIVVWALFILSSLEWSSARGHSTAEGAGVEQTFSPRARTDCGRIIILVDVIDRDLAMAPRLSMHLPASPPPGPTSRWLLLCTLRI